MNEDINKLIGGRLKQVRSIFNEGAGLSAEQFAHLVNETGDKIRNYELGRTAVSPVLLLELYRRGISITWLITGEGSRFADTEAGGRFRLSIERKIKALGGQATHPDAGTANFISEENILQIKAAAGNAEISNERKAKNKIRRNDK